MGKSTKKKHNPPTEHTRTFACAEGACKALQTMSGEEFKKHLLDVHKIDAIGGKQQLVTALDGEGFYSNTYKLSIDGGVTAYMYWSGPSRSYR